MEPQKQWTKLALMLVIIMSPSFIGNGRVCAAGSLTCQMEYDHRVYYIEPDHVIKFVDDTRTTCEAYLCDGDTGTARYAFFYSTTCDDGCVDMSGLVSYCRCRDESACAAARCETNPCYNGGTCEVDPNSYTWGFRCLCPSGFTGSHCQEKVCVDTHQDCPVWANEWEPSECDVNPTWMRKNCSLSCDTCGKCIDEVNNCPYWANNGACESYAPYMRQNCPYSCNVCADVNPCWGDQNPCQNGGTCVHTNTDADDEHSCICVPGYYGDNCQNSVDE